MNFSRDICVTCQRETINFNPEALDLHDVDTMLDKIRSKIFICPPSYDISPSIYFFPTSADIVHRKMFRLTVENREHLLMRTFTKHLCDE